VVLLHLLDDLVLLLQRDAFALALSTHTHTHTEEASQESGNQGGWIRGDKRRGEERRMHTLALLHHSYCS
jgi:acyl-CoA thioesterase